MESLMRTHQNISTEKPLGITPLRGGGSGMPTVLPPALLLVVLLMVTILQRTFFKLQFCQTVLRRGVVVHTTEGGFPSHLWPLLDHISLCYSI